MMHPNLSLILSTMHTQLLPWIELALNSLEWCFHWHCWLCLDLPPLFRSSLFKQISNDIFDLKHNTHWGISNFWLTFWITCLFWSLGKADFSNGNSLFWRQDLLIVDVAVVTALCRYLNHNKNSILSGFYWHLQLLVSWGSQGEDQVAHWDLSFTWTTLHTHFNLTVEPIAGDWSKIERQV